MSSLHVRAKALFLIALERPPADRSAFLAEACGNDTALRQEVESLLAFHSDAAQAATEAGRFAPGALFAGRYRMVTRIGRGGMGEVWRADDLVLQTPVALKRLHAAGPAARKRILNEVRLARQITHPAVCRVFDFGESDAELFFSMELVEGEDLATLLRRVGRLPVDKVIDIARQLCAGLAAAHATGVLHRDLKPANVLIDDDGRVHITDFGIAVTRKERNDRSVAGTPEHMAPEQLVGSTPLSERTDLYALGLIVYELVTGRRAFSASDERAVPIPASTIVPGLSPQFDRLLARALSPDPSRRFASAAEMAAQFPSTDAPHRKISWRGWLAAGLAAALAAGVAAVLVWPHPPPALSEQDTIVLADFENTTNEPVFDGALKVALAVALEQSPFLKVFPDDRVQETLRLMDRPAAQRITRPIAREIAQRERLKALIAGSISPLGTHYVLALEAVNVESGEAVAREQVEAVGKEQVLTSLGSAASRLRQQLGESLTSIQQFDVPLPRATTPSLEALNSYARALDEGRMNPRLEAIPHLKRALELDPDFALAQALLSGVYTNTGQSALAPQYSRRAFQLRDRVSERERYFIAFRYYRDATQDWDKALELARAWTRAYPREAFAFNALGIALLRFGDYEGALAPLRQALSLDSKFAPLYANLGGVLMSLDRFGEARTVLQEGAARQIDYFNMDRIAYLVAFVEGNQEAVDRHINAGMRLNQNGGAFGWRARSLAFGGRLAAAREQSRRGSQAAAQGGFREVAARLIVDDAEGRALVGRCEGIRSDVDEALEWSRDNFALEESARALLLCGHDAEAAGLVAELAKRYPEATLIKDISLPVAGALLALRQGRPARALALLEPVRPYDHAPWSGYWPAYLRGLAQLQQKAAGEAAAEFQSIVAHRGEDPDSLLYPLAVLGMARASALAGNLEQARTTYQQFLTLWKDADTGLAPLVESRRELARTTSALQTQAQ